MITDEERVKNLREIMEKSFRCSGSITIDETAFSCESIAQYYTGKFLNKFSDLVDYPEDDS